MKKKCAFTVMIGLLIAICGIHSYSGESPIKIGWAEVNITPPSSMFPIELRGQLYQRLAYTVKDPLTATALAIESDSGEQWILVSIDTIDLGPTSHGTTHWPLDDSGILAPLRTNLQGALSGFDLNKLTLVATHTHTAPYLNEDYPTNNPYYYFVMPKLKEVIMQAWDNRSYGGLSFEKGTANVGHCRIVKYTDGHHKMYGDTSLSTFAGMLTPDDPTLELMYCVDQNGGLTGIMINIVCPSQKDEAITQISADFWHDVRQELRQTYGNDIFILPYGGAAGDMSPRNLLGYTPTRSEIGERIADSVREQYPLAMNTIKYQVEMRHVVRNVNLTTKSSYHINHPVYNIPRPTYLVEIHAVLLDNTAWVNNPFECFNAWGKAIQNGSMASQTIIAQMSGLNRGGYLPTLEAVGGGTYSELLPNGWCDNVGAQQLVDNSVEMINSLFVPNTAPVANNDSATTDEDTAVIINVLANDTNVDGDTISVTQPPNGIAVINSDDTVTYTPDAGFVGNDSFTYNISDGNGETDTAIVSITVNPVGGGNTFIAINAGGGAYTASDGTQYVADQYFSGGSAYSTSTPISGTEEDILYQSERYGNPTYAIPFENGTYTVTVKFAEIYYNNSSEVDFDVVIEGTVAASGLDVWDQVGKNAAYDVTATITVSDGVLNISANNIKAIKVSDDGSTPADGLVWNADDSTYDLTFNGIDEYLEVADSPDLDFGSGNFTVACWVKKLESSGAGWDNVWGVNKWNSGAVSGTNEWSLALCGGGNDLPGFAIESGTTIYKVNGSQNLTIGQWHHLVGTRSGSEIHLYVDGQLVGSKAVGTASVNNAGRNLYVANSAVNGYLTKGYFDNINIYSRALSAAEIASMYQAGH